MIKNKRNDWASLVTLIVLFFSVTATSAVETDVNVWWERVVKATDHMERAKKAYEESTDSAERERRRQEYEHAEREHGEFNANLDSARIHAIAEAADVRPRKVRKMREAGMGWGKIAKTLGVHPSVIGKGHQTHKGKNHNDHHGGCDHEHTCEDGYKNDRDDEPAQKHDSKGKHKRKGKQ